MTIGYFTAGIDSYLRHMALRKAHLLEECQTKYPNGGAVYLVYVETAWLGEAWSGECAMLAAYYLVHSDVLGQCIAGMTTDTHQSLLQAIDSCNPQQELLFCFLTNINNHGVLVIDKL